MTSVVISSPHGERINRVDVVMGQVLLALVPGVLAMAWFFGWGILVNIAIAVPTALAAEALVVGMRGRSVIGALSDYSAVVTAVLFAIAVPPSLPWWLSVLGILFAIVIVKQLYGGLGYNPFNPAMAGYVFLLVSYPVQMTTWLPPDIPLVLQEQGLTSLGLVDTLRVIFIGGLPADLAWDAISSATPLEVVRTGLDQEQVIQEIQTGPFWGLIGGRGWEWVAVWFLIGGLYMLWRRIITWHIPVSMLASLALISGIFWLIDPSAYPSPAFHLISGAAIVGAFFIATDPVSGCTTLRGQLIFGTTVGLLVYVIRTWGGYPDAVAFSVLLMNIAAPTIDHYTQPRVFGQGKKG